MHGNMTVPYILEAEFHIADIHGLYIVFMQGVAATSNSPGRG